MLLRRFYQVYLIYSIFHSPACHRPIYVIFGICSRLPRLLNVLSRVPRFTPFFFVRFFAVSAFSEWSVFVCVFLCFLLFLVLFCVSLVFIIHVTTLSLVDNFSAIYLCRLLFPQFRQFQRGSPWFSLVSQVFRGVPLLPVLHRKYTSPFNVHDAYLFVRLHA